MSNQLPHIAIYFFPLISFIVKNLHDWAEMIFCLQFELDYSRTAQSTFLKCI